MVSASLFESAADIERDRDAINRIWKEYVASFEAGDLERWLALWTEDGVQMPDGAPQREGKAELRARTAETLMAFRAEFESLDMQEFCVAREWAYARGSYTAVFYPRQGGTAMPVDGKFLTIFTRQQDGAWKIHRDIFNSNVAP